MTRPVSIPKPDHLREPAPAQTRLAAIVRRAMDFIPLVSVGTKLRIERERAAYARQNDGLRRILADVSGDIRKIIQNDARYNLMRPFPVGVMIERDPVRMEPVLVSKFRYPDQNYCTPMSSYSHMTATEITQATHHVITAVGEEEARRIARYAVSQIIEDMHLAIARQGTADEIDLRDIREQIHLGKYIRLRGGD